jgi:hypothetical protein
MLYLKEFETLSEYNAYIASAEFAAPNVSFISELQEGEDVKYIDEEPAETRLVCKYDIDDVGTEYIANSISNFSSMEVDGVETEVNYSYNFETTGEHIIKFTLIDPTTISDDAFSRTYNLVDIIIPDSVTDIGSDAFDECNYLTGITIGSGVESIGSTFLAVCPRLTNINVSAANPYLSVRDGVLYDKAQTSLLLYPKTVQGSLSIPSGITSIGDQSFFGCTGLTSVIIPDGIVSISGYAFCNCVNLESVTIPNSVATIDYGAFSTCSSLSSVTIPSGVTYIENYVFDECTSLLTMPIHSGITSIGEASYRNCRGFTSIEIPSSVTSMGNAAFQSCKNLISITMNSTTPPTIDDRPFYDTNNCPIYVPAASVDVYKAASGWSEYASRIQAIP